MFLCCGEALWDVFVEPAPRGLTMSAVPGGAPLNVAIGLSRLGCETGLVAGIACDPSGERLLAMLQAEGVATEHLRRLELPCSYSLVSHGADGVPAYTILGEGAADRGLTREMLPALGPEVWGLHFASFALLVEPVGHAMEALAAAAGPRLISYDPNLRLGVVPDRAAWQRSARHWIARANLVKASVEDLALLSPEAAPEETARAWARSGPALVVLTRGSEGAVAFSGSSTVEVSGEVVAVIDTVGAGDSFAAALVAELEQRGISSPEALEAMPREMLASVLSTANRVAALSCTRRGANPPRREELGPP